MNVLVRERKQVAGLNLWIEIQALVRERKQVAGLNLWIEIQDLVRERKQVAGLNLWIEIQALVRERKQVAVLNLWAGLQFYPFNNVTSNGNTLQLFVCLCVYLWIPLLINRGGWDQITWFNLATCLFLSHTTRYFDCHRRVRWSKGWLLVLIE